MSTEPRGDSQRGKPLPVAKINQLKKWFERTRNVCESCRAAGVTRRTGKKYLGLRELPELDI